MRELPTPPEEVPDFVVERYAEHDPDTLRAIATYAETQNARAVDGEVPMYVIQAFKLQDSSTIAACGDYAAECADHIEAPGESEADDDSDDDDDGAPIMGGSFFG